MTAYVVGAERRKGTSKKTNKEYDAVVTHVIFPGENESDKKEVEVVWIDPNLLVGNIPEYGDVLDLQYNRQGFLVGVTVITNQMFTLVIKDI